jgi:heme exporter protein A
MSITLEVDQLTCIRSHRVLFRDLSFRVKPGELLCIEGSNGAGKTSLLRLIAGFLQPARGTVRLQTASGMIADAEERGSFVGWIGHQDAAKPQLSVREQLGFFAQLYRSLRSPVEAMEAFGLSTLAEVPGQFLSAGQKRRLALARLMLCSRPLWLLDEPLAALDTAGRALVIDAISRHCASGGLVLAATHDPLGLACETLNLGGAA